MNREDNAGLTGDAREEIREAVARGRARINHPLGLEPGCYFTRERSGIRRQQSGGLRAKEAHTEAAFL